MAMLSACRASAVALSAFRKKLSNRSRCSLLRYFRICQSSVLHITPLARSECAHHVWIGVSNAVAEDQVAALDHHVFCYHVNALAVGRDDCVSVHVTTLFGGSA